MEGSPVHPVGPADPGQPTPLSPSNGSGIRPAASRSRMDLTGHGRRDAPFGNRRPPAAGSPRHRLHRPAGSRRMRSNRSGGRMVLRSWAGCQKSPRQRYLTGSVARNRRPEDSRARSLLQTPGSTPAAITDRRCSVRSAASSEHSVTVEHLADLAGVRGVVRAGWVQRYQREQVERPQQRGGSD